MITVRPAVPDDAERMVDIRLAGWRENFAHLLSAEFLAEMTGDVEQMRDGITRSVRTEHHVAVVDGEVVAFAIAGPAQDGEPREWQLFLIYQYSRMHGSGTGQALLDAAVGERPAVLWTAEDNPRAQAFYRRNGFVPDGARKVASEWENLAEIRMVR
jgi:ribosomal protein S18 acetylase RimI-like enzyme